MIEFLFSKPLPSDIEQFINNPNLPKIYRKQLRIFAKYYNNSVKSTKYINRQWNYVAKKS